MGLNYFVKRGSIIKTRESLELGATFLNYTIVTNLNACLVECWITDSCDTAIYQESPVDFANQLPLRPDLVGSRAYLISGGGGEELNEISGASRDRRGDGPGFFICYLFNCGQLDGFKCQFSAHNYYISSVKQAALVSEQLSSTMRSLSANNDVDTDHSRMQDDQPARFNPDDDNRRLKFVAELEPSLNSNKQQQQRIRESNSVHYSKIIQTNPQQSLAQRRPWSQEQHIASIRIGAGQSLDEAQSRAGSVGGAIIAIGLGVAITGMLSIVVFHKMSSIPGKVASKARRRTLVPDADLLLINTQLAANMLVNLHQLEQTGPKQTSKR